MWFVAYLALNVCLWQVTLKVFRLYFMNGANLVQSLNYSRANCSPPLSHDLSHPIFKMFFFFKKGSLGSLHHCILFILFHFFTYFFTSRSLISQLTTSARHSLAREKYFRFDPPALIDCDFELESFFFCGLLSRERENVCDGKIKGRDKEPPKFSFGSGS